MITCSGIHRIDSLVVLEDATLPLVYHVVPSTIAIRQDQDGDHLLRLIKYRYPLELAREDETNAGAFCFLQLKLSNSVAELDRVREHLAASLGASDRERLHVQTLDWDGGTVRVLFAGDAEWQTAVIGNLVCAFRAMAVPETGLFEAACGKGLGLGVVADLRVKEECVAGRLSMAVDGSRLCAAIQWPHRLETDLTVDLERISDSVVECTVETAHEPARSNAGASASLPEDAGVPSARTGPRARERVEAGA